MPANRKMLQDFIDRNRAVEIFIQQILNGLSIASVITLIAVGVTLIFGLTGIINFAHGEFLMVGSIVTWAEPGIGAVAWCCNATSRR